MNHHRHVALLACVAAGSTLSLIAEDDKPIRALFIAGGCCHDYAHQKVILPKGVSARANVVWKIAYDPVGGTDHPNPIYNDPDWAKDLDVVVHDECSADVKVKEFVDGILAPHLKGLPAVNLHCAMHCYRVPGSDDWFKFTGLTTHSHGAQLPIELSFVAKDHPILKGLSEWTTIHEEQYHNEKVWETVTPLVRGKQGKDDDLVVWTNDFHGTKVFSTTLGHNNETVSDPRYLDLVTRGLLWTVGKLDDQHFHAPVAPIEAPNLAKGKPATASTNEGDAHAAGKATDGDGATRWCASDASVPQWWQVDLGKAEDLGGCEIDWESDAASYTYTVKGSADGQQWNVLVESGKTKPEDDGSFAFAAKGVRYLRVDTTATAAGKWVSFFEFKAFGAKGAKAAGK